KLILVPCFLKAMKTAVLALAIGLFPANASATHRPERGQAEALMPPPAIKHPPPVVQDNLSVCRSNSTDCDSELSRCRALPNGNIRRCVPAPMELFITWKLRALRARAAVVASEAAPRTN